MRLAPHLPHEKITEIVNHGRQGRRVYFSGPPLRVHGALQIFCIDSPRQGGVYGLPLVYHAFVQKRPESFVNHPEIKKTTEQLKPDQIEWAELAEEYACKHWPEEMVWDDCSSVMIGFLIQPGPDFKRISQFTAWSRGKFPDMLAFDNEPTCEVIDDSLLEISIWEPSQLELSTGHMGFAANFCSLCGGGIDERKCTFCDAVFNMPRTSAPWPYALPQLAADAYKRVGYDGKIPPVEARKAEHRIWAQQGFVPQIPIEYLDHGKQQRSIEL